MKILIFTSDNSLRMNLILHLEAFFEGQIFEVDNILEAIKYIDEGVDFVIADFDCEPKILYEKIKTKTIRPFIIFMTEMSKEEITDYSFEFHDFLIENNSTIDKLLAPEVMTNLLKDKLKANDSVVINKYCRVNIERFTKHSMIPCDIYMKLSSDKYVKILNKNAENLSETLKKYSKKGVENYYIEQKYFEVFCKNLMDSLKNHLIRQDVDLQTRVNLELTGMSFVHEAVSNLGIDQRTVEMMNTTIYSSIASVKKNNNIFELLDTVVKNNNFIYEHSLLTSCVTASMSMAMDWNSSLTIKKLAMASMMHDMMIVDVDMAKIQGMDSFLVDDLAMTRTQLEQIRLHPPKTCTMVEEIEELLPDVAPIILCHHEKPDGTGFHRGLCHKNTPPMACLFIIAEDFVHKIFDKKLTRDLIDQIKDDFTKRYKTGNYEESLNGFIQLLDQNKLSV